MTTEDTLGAELKACVKNHAKEILAGFSSEELWRNYAEAVENLCRKLERERDEAKKHLRDIWEYGTEEINAAVELRQKLAAALLERDEAREALENYKASTVHSCNEECKRPMCVLRRERDEAREDARLLAERLTRLELDSSLALAKLERERNELKKALEGAK